MIAVVGVGVVDGIIVVVVVVAMIIIIMERIIMV
jgi:hypothetical protein